VKDDRVNPTQAQIILSAEQQRVVAHRAEHIQVIACAGSGKTEAISRRVAGLIEEGVEPAQIIAFTFTERAADSLKARITRRVGEIKGSAFLDRLGPMFVGNGWSDLLIAGWHGLLEWPLIPHNGCRCGR
jgi:superfamily I DNA/RNA helicase